MTLASLKETQRWFVLVLILFSLDWLTKQWVELSLYYGQEIPVLPFFDFTLRYNTGAAFSFLAEQGGWQRWFLALLAISVSLGISWRLLVLGRNNFWESLSLSLILAGALGNLYDRLVYGHVVDFIQFHWQQSWYFPAFNVADSVITLGVIVMLLEGFLKKSTDGKND